VNEPRNIDVVRRGLEAFLRGDPDAALEAVSPDLVSVRTPPLPDPQTYHGPDGVLQMWSDWTADFDRFEMAVGEIAEVHGRVLVEVPQRARGRSSGAEVEATFWFLFTLAEGQVLRLDGFASREQAMEAAARPRR
jgi:ketosteroid isomerase-like protein